MFENMWARILGNLLNADSAETESGDEGGGGGDEPERKFTQAELDKIVERRLAKERRRFADYDSIRERAARADELESEIESLRGQSQGTGDKDAGPSPAERALARERKEREKLEATIAEERKAREAAAAELRATRLGYRVNEALSAAKAYPKALADARRVFEAASRIETDDAGEIVEVILGDESYPSLEKAIESFLSERPHFQSGVGGGAAGSRERGPGVGRRIEDMTTSDLLRRGWADAMARKR